MSIIVMFYNIYVMRLINHLQTKKDIEIYDISLYSFSN